MMLGLGAGGSLINALQALTSSKSSSATTSTGQSQGVANPFDLGGGSQTQGTTGFSAGGTSGPSISPQTMSTLIQAQGQPGATSTDPAFQVNALTNLTDKIKLQPIDISQLKITALDPTGLVNWASFDARL
jgi:hypothetical protein